MAKRSRVYTKLDWNGGVNTTVDSGLLDDKYLVQADNVIFTTTGARIKREGHSYIDSGVPVPTLAESSGTTKTVHFTNPLDRITLSGPDDSRLVVGETITVTGNASFAAAASPITSITDRAEVTSVQCMADVSGSLNNKYFLINSVLDTSKYYVWFNVDSGGTDPAIAGRTGAAVAIAAGDSASTVAAALQTVLDGLAAFTATVDTDTVTVTAAANGPASAAVDVNTGFIISVTTDGSQSLTYEGTTSLTVSETAVSGLLITRSAAVVGLQDYWYFDTAYVKQQLLVAYTADKKMFKFDANGRRTEIAGQPEVTKIVCVADTSKSLQNKYFYISAANNETQYYVWYDVNSEGVDPAISNKTGIKVSIATNATAAAVAAATKTAIDALADFTATISNPPPLAANEVTITNAAAGIAEHASNGNVPGLTLSVLAAAATVPTGTVRAVKSIVFANKLIWTFEGPDELPIVFDPQASSSYQLLAGAPDASIMQEHVGRLFANDKTEPDRLHYCAPFNPVVWLGNGDSGAIDIGSDDGDERGITAIFPSFKGRLFVAKTAKLYQLYGETPEWYRVESVSTGIGAVSHSACAAVDQDDILYMSRRGIHSVAATSAYGDFTAKYVSSNIQPTFDSWIASDLRYSSAVYIPTLNSIVFNVTERGARQPNAIWLYNSVFQEWYRWPNINAVCVAPFIVDSVSKLIYGTSDGRVVMTQNGTYQDFETQPIRYKIKTGTIYPDKQIQSLKSIRRLTLYYKPIGDFQFTASVKVDSAPAQALVFEQQSSGDLLGSTFILGQSVLGTAGNVAPYTQTIDGFGRGFTLEIVNDELGEQVEIYGFGVEYVDADNRQEVV